MREFDYGDSWMRIEDILEDNQEWEHNVNKVKRSLFTLDAHGREKKALNEKTKRLNPKKRRS